ncbi:MAG: PEPxxWA-CTERM sorting domain-containing protein [Sphingomonadaceae bacterium]
MRLLAKTTAAAMTIAFAMGSASAATVADPVGDFLPGFVGAQDADLDVTSFSVDFDDATQNFMLGATFAGVINPALAGRYVVGVNTGSGVIAPFGGIGQGNVIFNQAIIILKDGTATLGGNPLAAGSVTIAGNSFSATVALSLLPSTGFVAGNYGWNIWPRNDGAGVAAISDFAPENALLVAVAVPEPTTWSLMIGGFGIAGAALRRQRTLRLQTAG